MDEYVDRCGILIYPRFKKHIN